MVCRGQLTISPIRPATMLVVVSQLALGCGASTNQPLQQTGGTNAMTPGASGATATGAVAGGSPGVASGGRTAAGGSQSGTSSGGTTAPSAGNAGQPGGGSSTATGGTAAATGGSANAAGGIGGAAAGMGGAAAGIGGSAGTGGTGFGTVAAADLSKDGPYMSTTVKNTGPNNNYTIYRPQQLGPGGAKNPFVAWISGGGSSPDQYTLLPHLATHGFVIIASNTVPQVGQQQALGKEMVAAVDWMLMEIQRSGSDYAAKVDATKVAAMGYSMGGLAATAAGADPRWTTTVHISGGAGDGSVKNLHAPAAMLCGASGVDIAGANCATDFQQATTPVFYGVFNGGDHLGVRTPPYSDRIATVITGWLRWQLMGDQTLKAMFVGDTCAVCTDSNWTVKQKNLQ